MYAFTFFPQTTVPSDTFYHISFAKKLFSGNSPKACYTYPLFYAMVSVLGEVIGDYTFSATTVIAFFAAIACCLQIFVLKYFLDNVSSSPKILFYGFALSFIWPWNFLCYDVGSLYLLSGCTAPVHNATYLIGKPFALACFFVYYLMIDTKMKQIEKKGNLRKQSYMLFLFSVLFFLSVLAKPNFYQVFAPAGAIVAIIFWLYYGNSVFLFCCKLAMAFLPATVWVIVNAEKTISVRISPLEGYKIYNTLPPWIGILQSLFFVLFVLVSCLVFRRNDILLLIAVAVWIFGAIEFFLLVQNGEEASLNFMWGLLCSQYLLFFSSIVSFERLKEKYKGNLYNFGQFLFFGHFATGVYAFITYSKQFWSLIK